jgi:hypothetical protein
MQMKTQTKRLFTFKLKTCHARFLPLHTSNNNQQLAGFLLLDSLYLATLRIWRKETLIHWNPGYAQTRWIGRFLTLDKIDNQHREPAQSNGKATTEQH